MGLYKSLHFSCFYFIHDKAEIYLKLPHKKYVVLRHMNMNYGFQEACVTEQI